MGGVNPIIAFLQRGLACCVVVMAKLPVIFLRHTARGRLSNGVWTHTSWGAVLPTASVLSFRGVSHDSRPAQDESSKQRQDDHRPPLLPDRLTEISSLFGSKRSEQRDRKRSKLAGALLGGALGSLGTALSVWYLWNRGNASSSLTSNDQAQKRLPSLRSIPFPQLRAHCLDDSGSDDNRPSKRYNFLAEAVEISAPSVVFIERHRKVATIFGEATSVSSGSGFVVGDGTYVLTNAHVVGNSKTVKVELKSGRKLNGEVTDMDQIADLALIKVNLPSDEKLPALEFGSSSKLRPGEWVVALGSPLSLSNTITAGIVSSVHRPSKELGLHQYKPDMEYVQTDAPITVGNSGGPLVNLDGKVIGVNTMTAGPGISFAIPSDFAKKFVENASGKTVRKKPRLWGETKYAIGVSMVSVTPGLLMHMRYRSSLPSIATHGVLLAEVWPDGAAAAAGLRKFDVIVKINGKDIYTCSDVVEMVHSGAKLEMEVARESKWLDITVQPEPLD